MVTAGTYRKQPFFRSRTLLDFLTENLLKLAEHHAWMLQAWAVFANHYHFVALAPSDAASLVQFSKHLHSLTAIEVNRRNHTPGSRVWFNYWDSHLTYQKSYFARLSYVHQNAVHHKLVRASSAYPWCSAGWFERKADRAFFRTIMEFPCNRIKVPDEYAVKPMEVAG